LEIGEPVQRGHGGQDLCVGSVLVRIGVAVPGDLLSRDGVEEAVIIAGNDHQCP
jgi:hypothetical protein